VIIGKLIPAGTGFQEAHEDELLEPGLEPQALPEGTDGEPGEEDELKTTLKILDLLESELGPTTPDEQIPESESSPETERSTESKQVDV
jgi:hypothetical protein